MARSGILKQSFGHSDCDIVHRSGRDGFGGIMDRGRIPAASGVRSYLKRMGSHNVFLDYVNHGLGCGGFLT